MPQSPDRSGGSDLLRIGLVVLAVVLGVPLLMMLLAVPMMGLWMYGDGHMMATGAAELGVFLMMLVPLLLVALGGVYLLRTVSGGDGGTDPALEELRQAYARGDLSDEEFERRRERLER